MNRRLRFGSAEGEICACLGQANAPDEFCFGRPDRYAAVAHVVAGVASAPQVAVHVHANTVGAALDAIDHEIAEKLLIAEPIVAADVEDYEGPRG